MLDSINEQTSISKQANLPSHDDSGYDGLGSASKVLDQPEEAKSSEPYDARKIRNLLETCFTVSSPAMFWVTTMNYLMVVVVVASVCYIIMMGDKRGDDLEVKLGGKRAAIQYYYDSVYGVQDGI
jgi:hypothetical protein